ncbi:MAG: hypothetical protein LBV47_02070 [Bacteroidales bacterium]|jgi:hypothetical protein|nr:hypothetical protein [Bacteroidales bacterium]
MNNIGKITIIFLRVLIFVSAVLIILLFTNISVNKQTPAAINWIDSNLIWAYILIFAGAVFAVLSGLIQAINDLKSTKKVLIATGSFAVVILFSYLFASDSLPQFFGVEKYINNGILTIQVAKLIDMGLYTTYILIGFAVLLIALSPISRLFR